MLRLKYLVAACALILTVGSVNANTFTVFDVNGSFNNNAGTSVSGTLTVDVTAGIVTAVDFIVPGFLPFTDLANPGVISSPTGFGEWFLRVYNADLFPSKFDMTLALSPATGSLIGYAGSQFNNGMIFLGTNVNQISPDLATAAGTITPQLASTPLPAALPLFATGLGVMGWLAKRRKRRAAAALAA